MHPSQYEHMKRALAQHLPKGQHLNVLELGSATSPGQTQTHRTLFADVEHTYFGVDVRPGDAVDAVMTQPYTIPARTASQDVVMCGSVLEHVPFFWASAMEMARVLKPQGLLFVTVPSRGHKHSPIDCWRMYPDGLRAIATWSRLTLLESHVHYPPPTQTDRHDYPAIDAVHDYWGDAVAVFCKPARYPWQAKVMQRAICLWANRASTGGPLGKTPRPRQDCDVPTDLRQRAS